MGCSHFLYAVSWPHRNRLEQKLALTFDRIQSDTIAAIATSTAEAGIGIVRLSGPDAFSITGNIFRNQEGKAVSISGWKSATIHYGFIVDPDAEDEKLDEVLVSILRSPHSYTTEDTIEINTHGGSYVEHRVLELVLRKGARLAEAGEFTKRAFLGGRIDLSRAEAVMDLIRSQNEFARKTSLACLEGSVEAEVKKLRSGLLYEIAFIESALDDPENYSLEGYPSKLDHILTEMIDELDRLLLFSKSGRVLTEGIDTVIAGKPNAGKSSLLNELSGSERAIVTEIAGTTRDTLEETVRIRDDYDSEILLHLTDTAGIHNTADAVEKIGVQRALKAIEHAQLILFVLDISRELDEEDIRIAEKLKSFGTMKKTIALLNKSDLPGRITKEDVRNIIPDSSPVISISLETGMGIRELKNEISRMFRLGDIQNSNEVFLANIRQCTLAQDARDSLALVRQSIRKGMPEDFFSIDLRNAYTSLGLIIGEEVEDDLVNEIFSRFCLGK